MPEMDSGRSNKVSRKMAKYFIHKWNIEIQP